MSKVNVVADMNSLYGAVRNRFPAAEYIELSVSFTYHSPLCGLPERNAILFDLWVKDADGARFVADDVTLAQLQAAIADPVDTQVLVKEGC